MHKEMRQLLYAMRFNEIEIELIVSFLLDFILQGRGSAAQDHSYEDLL